MVSVLLIDDNPLDIQLTERAVREAGVDLVVESHTDPEAALKRLIEMRDRGEPAPGAVLMDIRMPRRNGFEVLQRMKGDERLCGIPVLMFSSSQACGDVSRAETLHADGYIGKPTDYPSYLEFAQRLARWVRGDCCPECQAGH